MLCRPCIFCEIVEGNIPGKLIYKDEHIAAFDDINPAAETHILIVPVAHIESVKTLQPTNYDLLERMKSKAIDLLQDRGQNPENSKLGFHVPPFNTVNHLHLHVLGGELKSRFRKLKYQTGRVWYQDLDQVVDKFKRVRDGARL
ncbi:hypothetical protein BG006_009213 [Podila minutissima]|uniref:HIT domain-containing protein n=1 Tax=Podila minutissima TaxID=64525 RepID=A0A9P5VQ16_9FUNG|nr:hypothetical protein BG006_009213 [Podila minutissima]